MGYEVCSTEPTIKNCPPLRYSRISRNGGYFFRLCPCRKKVVEFMRRRFYDETNSLIYYWHILSGNRRGLKFHQFNNYKYIER